MSNASDRKYIVNLMDEVDNAFKEDDRRLAHHLIQEVGVYYNHEWGNAPTHVLDRLAGWKSNLGESTGWIHFIICKREGIRFEYH
jgi:hypothetical protein